MTIQEIQRMKQLKVDLHHLFGTEAGERVMKWLEETCFFFDTTSAPTDKETLINEGRRQVVLSLKNMMVLEVDKLIPEEIRTEE